MFNIKFIHSVFRINLTHFSSEEKTRSPFSLEPKHHRVTFPCKSKTKTRDVACKGGGATRSISAPSVSCLPVRSHAFSSGVRFSSAFKPPSSSFL
ncbi:unnamed protein product [Trifolium pratense]|uniref:Uncharacterized protein n=1 Tax=Trifolium pratense TaxID=57577 RepID=A0ACB0IP77_TRIPR|nr:unnamed protein product [Trifolium pratense]